jgi:hypothetical protein
MTKEEFLEIISTNENGKLKHRESKKLEYKANFNFKNMNEYSKTMAAFANTKGGIIVFGITDSPRKAVGMTNNNFEHTDEEKITGYLNEYFEPEIEWKKYIFEIENKKFGVILVNEAFDKPIVCKKNTRNDKARESDIFYRYTGRTDRIKYTELRKILDEKIEKINKKWFEHIQNISKIGPENIALIDVLRGEIPSENAKILIDKKLLKNIKFIQEGKFVEKEGAPALKLVGEVEGVEIVTPKFNLEDDFYTTKELAKELNLLPESEFTGYMTAIIKKYKIQEKEEYYQQKGSQKFYSRLALEFLKSKNIPLEEAKKIYKDYLSSRKKNDN